MVRKSQTITILKPCVWHLCGTKQPFIPCCLTSTWSAPSSAHSLPEPADLDPLRWPPSRPLRCIPQLWEEPPWQPLLGDTSAFSWARSWQIFSCVRPRSLKPHNMKCPVPKASLGRILRSKKEYPVSSKTAYLWVLSKWSGLRILFLFYYEKRCQARLHSTCDF